MTCRGHSRVRGASRARAGHAAWQQLARSGHPLAKIGIMQVPGSKAGKVSAVTNADVQRRLAAILAADVVGYSRLMGQDEAGTLAAVRTLFAEVMEPKIAEHQGRLFKTMGDGFLVEFPSVVNAVLARWPSRRPWRRAMQTCPKTEPSNSVSA